MSCSIGWPEIGLRLVLAVVGGALLGLNRSERGMTAGLRTTLLVCLAAAVSMIQVNLLLDTAGRPADSFIMMDLMRLPLGILTGMGFIGAGAILRRGDRVRGITTAATLWLVTVIGLCFGGGQHGLGLATLGLGVVILWMLKELERRLQQDRRAMLTLTLTEAGPSDEEIRVGLQAIGYRMSSWDATYTRRGESRRRRIRSEVHWQGRDAQMQPPEAVRRLAQQEGILSLRWQA